MKPRRSKPVPAVLTGEEQLRSIAEASAFLSGLRLRWTATPDQVDHEKLLTAAVGHLVRLEYVDPLKCRHWINEVATVTGIPESVLIERVDKDTAFYNTTANAAAIPTEPQTAIELILQQRKFNPNITPPSLRTVYSLDEQVIATPGNLATITAMPKAGKTATIGGMIASVIAECSGGDFLGFSSSNPNSLALLHFDSEQSPDDHWHQVARALKRAGLQKPPPWLYSYCLTGLGYAQAWECVCEATRRASNQHPGIHSILIDGAADLVNDVNDPTESNDFVATLHGNAIQYDCPIISAIHFNPGGEKTRGHLGSQLERKAETNLRLDKPHEVTTIWSNKQRRAPIPKATGPCFLWSDEAGMHITCETGNDRREAAKEERMRVEVQKVFRDSKAMRYSDLKSTVMSRLSVSDRTAEKKIAVYRQKKLVTDGATGLLIFKG